MKYRVLIEIDEDGVFIASVPALPGCVSDGRTRVEAVGNIKEAMTAYIESLVKSGDPVPSPLTDDEIIEINIAEIDPASGAA